LRSAYRPPDRDKYLVEAEIKKLLSAANRVLSERNYLLLFFSAHTGCRPSEILNVTAKDFRWKEGNVRVKTLKQKIDKRTGKQKVVFRDVDMAQDCVKVLKKWVQTQPQTKTLWPFTRQYAWKLFKKAAEAARLSSSYTLYSLRHGRVIHLLQITDRDYDYVMGQMGHSDVNVTMSYAHILPGVRQQYRDRMKGF
jgi:integrase